MGVAAPSMKSLLYRCCIDQRDNGNGFTLGTLHFRRRRVCTKKQPVAVSVGVIEGHYKQTH